MKLCIIGNSHVGALKRACANHESLNQNVSFTFFVGRGNSISSLDISDSKLTPSSKYLRDSFMFTSGGLSEIQVRDYDLFLVYGLGCKPLYFPKEKFYSSDLIEHTCKDHVDGTVSTKVLRLLKSAGARQIYLGHDPLRASNELQPLGDDLSLYKRGVNLLNRKFYEPENSILVPQPDETLESSFSTKEIYSKDSTRPETGGANDNELHPSDDNVHMNEHYGKLWLENFINNYLKQR